MEKTNKIITIDRKLVRVAYTGAANHCNRCCIKGARCRVRLEPCKKYNDPNSPHHAIFVPADDGEADTTAQARPIPSDVQEAADKYIGHPYEVAEGVEVSMRREAYAAGMLAERERMASCPTIKGWVARDGHGALVFSNEKPSRVVWCGWNLWKVSRGTPAVVLPNSLLPSLRWEDEPKPVRVIIEEIK